MNEKTFDEIVAGQKAVLEAAKEIISGKNFAFVVGAVVALEGQANALKKHIMESIPDPISSIVMLELAKNMYENSVSTEIASYKKEVEDEEHD